MRTAPPSQHLQCSDGQDFWQDAATIVLVLVMGFLVIVDRKSREPSISGLVLSLMLATVQVVQVVVREWSDVESAMNSIRQEPDHASILPAEEWPQRGEVRFSDTRMRYRSGLPEALKGVNLHTRGGEHVAINNRPYWRWQVVYC